MPEVNVNYKGIKERFLEAAMLDPLVYNDCPDMRGVLAKLKQQPDGRRYSYTNIGTHLHPPIKRSGVGFRVTGEHADMWDFAIADALKAIRLQNAPLKCELHNYDTFKQFLCDLGVIKQESASLPEVYEEMGLREALIVLTDATCVSRTDLFPPELTGKKSTGDVWFNYNLESKTINPEFVKTVSEALAPHLREGQEKGWLDENYFPTEDVRGLFLKTATKSTQFTIDKKKVFGDHTDDFSACMEAAKRLMARVNGGKTLDDAPPEPVFRKIRQLVV